jgi:ABC-type nitrate/sulfonate/bicarbonate transport system substrate-binding protein
MKKSIVLSGCALLLVIVIGGWLWHRSAQHHTNSGTAQDSLSLALDWTPNTNHTGIYVALEKGWYKAAGINLKLLPYSASVSADQLVATGKADVGISSTEGVVSDAGSGSPVVSIAAIVAHNTSVLAVRKDSGITSPSQLEGKIYGGFGAPYESAVISQVIKHAGGSGAFQNVTLDIDPIQALQTKKVDFVWVFSGWEVIQAQRAGLALTTFPITSYGVPDYSTPNVITSAQTIKQKRQLLKKFMTATARGYEYARANPEASAKILIDSVPKGTFPDPGLVTASQQYLSLRYQDVGKPWGVQTAASWHNYPEFMLDHGAVVDAAGKSVTKLDFNSLYSNEFLQ